MVFKRAAGGRSDLYIHNSRACDTVGSEIPMKIMLGRSRYSSDFGLLNFGDRQSSLSRTVFFTRLFS